MGKIIYGIAIYRGREVYFFSIFRAIYGICTRHKVWKGYLLTPKQLPWLRGLVFTSHYVGGIGLEPTTSSV